MSALGVTTAPVARPTEPTELTRDLYERYGQRVFTFCYSRLRDREAAQDAAQTTFIYVLRSLQRGVVPEFELAWLLKIAFNVCRGVRRSEGRQTAVTTDVEDIDALAAPAAPGLEGTERLAALRAGLASLPDNQRRGILLREWQGLSYAEIADELGTTVGAVETLLFRARRNLASRLQHVRSGVGALDVASLAMVFRSVFRGGLVKLGLLGAGASIALVPVVAVAVSPALGDRRPDVRLQPVASTVAPRETTHRVAASRRSVAIVAGNRERPAAAAPRRVPATPRVALPELSPVAANVPAPADPGAVPPSSSGPDPAPPPLTSPPLEPAAASLPTAELPTATAIDPVDTLVRSIGGIATDLP
jgi:RNA polymerase sigma-70 factor (ECF subfamily)